MAEIDMENTRDYPSEVMAEPIKLAQKLRSLLLKIIAVEKERAEYAASDEASDEELRDAFDTFNEAVSGEVPAVDLLAQIDQLIYSLIDYEPPGDRWFDADDVESKEVLKLKEIVVRDNQFKLSEILLAPAA